ncbi:MAG: DUF4234 domain-containing protein [Bifidobacteriaceae bacterium]|jgi:hypothetical protein|nr:DUF4234 domain-containing protein [Bifidobacteriaceae bacterium]
MTEYTSNNNSDNSNFSNNNHSNKRTINLEININSDNNGYSYLPARRSIGLWIFLSIITCGLCYLVWIALINQDIQDSLEQKSKRSSAAVVLFSLITCSIYTIYWTYVTSTDLENIENNKNLSPRNEGIIYVILSIFGLSIISLALLQNRLNIVSNQN